MHPKGAKTISINPGASSRLTPAVSVAMDQTKLPLVVILQEAPEGFVEKAQSCIYTPGIVASVQQKARIDARTMQIWYEKVLKAHISDCSNRVGVLLDDFICHKSENED